MDPEMEFWFKTSIEARRAVLKYMYENDLADADLRRQWRAIRPLPDPEVLLEKIQAMGDS